MKTFCILEQGNKIGEKLTKKKKDIFSTDFSDFYRLNWSGNKDPDAFISLKGLTWSEGRSLLYQKVPKNYEYYIFCDDDIDFINCENKSIADNIKNLLDTYSPISATFLDKNSWSLSWIKKFDKSQIIKREVFPIAGFDLQVHIFQKEFADMMLPAIYHGSGRTLSYAQWVCNQIYPYKQHCYSNIEVSNTRHELHSDTSLSHFSSGEKVVWLFNRHVKLQNNGIPIDKREISLKNSKLFEYYASSDKVLIQKNDLDKVYDTNNYYYKNRVTLITSVYSNQLKKLNILWILSLTRVRLLISKFKAKFLILISKIINKKNAD